MMRNKDFAVFILTHGRAENVVTYKTLRKENYTGDIYIIIDDMDKQMDKYKEIYGDKVIVFNKQEIAKTFDTMDNFDDLRAVVYARNACFDIARKLGLKYFFELDDDYANFNYRINPQQEFVGREITNLDNVLDSLLDYYKKIPAKSIALAQGGDFFGGGSNTIFSSETRIRKCMNTFICSPDRPFQFYGRINEDVNCYVKNGSMGELFFTIPFLSINQQATQSNPGGLTDIYLNYGTYVKSFYSVMIHPSSVKITVMGESGRRIHHRVDGKSTYPMILSEDLKKK